MRKLRQKTEDQRSEGSIHCTDRAQKTHTLLLNKEEILTSFFISFIYCHFFLFAFPISCVETIYWCFILPPFFIILNLFIPWQSLMISPFSTIVELNSYTVSFFIITKSLIFNKEIHKIKTQARKHIPLQRNKNY